MNKELFKEFKSEFRAFLYCEEFDIRIKHAEFERTLQSHEFDDNGTLYVVERYRCSRKNIRCYMTAHMILKAFKKYNFEIGLFQRGA